VDPAITADALADASPEEVAAQQFGIGVVHYSVEQAQRAREVLARLHALRRAVRFYPMEHPSVRENIAMLERVVSTYHQEGVELQLAFYGGEVFLGDQLLSEESVTYDQFVNDMHSIGVGSLAFRQGLDQGELARASIIIGADEELAAAAGGVLVMAREAELEHVLIGRVLAAETSVSATDDELPLRAFDQAVEFMEDIDDSIKRGGSVGPGKVRTVVRSLIDGVLRNRHSMLQLTSLKNYDEYTFYHSVNVAILSLALGSVITTDERFLSLLGTSALLHDIGKLKVGHDIINKPGQLTPEEWDTMQRHPAAGAQMLVSTPGLDPLTMVPVLQHHVRLDGGGYPKLVKGRRQNLMSRIVAIADAYDAMTSRRSYSAARVQDQAMAQLAQGAGVTVDAVLVRLFANMLGMFPPRTVVRLNSGEVAIVIAPTDGEPYNPEVRVIAASTGEFIEPYDVVLADRDDLDVAGTLDPRLLNIEVDDYI
jgi:HD-GYP domain-containing protein (c-di-GMP phosphodiesterase class II)